MRAAGNAAYWVESDMPRKKSSASDGMLASAGVHGLTGAPALDCCNAQGDVTKVAMGSTAEGTLAKKAVTKRAALTKRSETRERRALVPKRALGLGCLETHECQHVILSLYLDTKAGEQVFREIESR